MKTIAILLKDLWNHDFSAKKTILSMICCAGWITGTVAQVETYDIISTSGSIVDVKSGKKLQVGDRVTLQTELQFNSLNDRAVILNPEKTKYFLELPKSSFVNSKLTVTSDQALTPVKTRPALITGVRGSAMLITKEISPKSLNEYFEIDTFTIIGDKFTLPVPRQNTSKYSLLLRHEIGNTVEEYVSNDFTISKKDLKLQSNHIPECYVLLKEGDKTIPITVLSLFFVDKKQLFNEFNSLMKALKLSKKDKNKARETLRQYCTDVYGMIDRNTLETTIKEYLGVK